MMYDNYVNKIQKLAKIKNIIYKLRFVIIGVFTAIVVLIVSLLANKGKISLFEMPEELTYGDSLNIKSESFMSDISYQYRLEGTSEWHDGLPEFAGVYEVRVVTNAAFGENYSDSKKLVINKKPLGISLKSTTIEYGSYPELNLSGLTSKDHVEHEIYTYEDVTKTNTIVNLNLEALNIVNTEGIDVTSNYEISIDGQFNINFTKLHTSINGVTLQKEYDGTPIQITNMYSVTNLGYDDKMVCDNITYDIYDSNNQKIEEAINAGNYRLIATGFDIVNSTNNSTLGNYNINNYNNGILTSIVIEKRALNITTASSTYTYDGFEHKNEDYTYSGQLIGDDHLVVTSSAVIQKAGNVRNELSFKVLNGYSDNSSNYNINVNYGTLTINKKDISIETSNFETIYNGTSQNYNDYNQSGLCSNHHIGITSNESYTNVGVYDNVISVDIYDYNNSNVSRNYNISYNYGKITINKKPVSVNIYGSLIYGESKIDYQVYDNYYNYYYNGDYDTISYSNQIIINKLDSNSYTQSNSQFNFVLTSKNYEFSVNSYQIDIEQRELVVNVKSDTVITYDSKEYIYQLNRDYTLSNLVNGDSIELDFEYYDKNGYLTTSHKNVGTYIVKASNNTLGQNYYIDYSDFNIYNLNNLDYGFVGLLKVEKKKLTIYTHDLSTVYDGYEHYDDSTENNGLLSNHRINPTGCVKAINVGEYTNYVYYVILDELNYDVTSNYEITEYLGTIRILKKKLVLYINDVNSRDYNGEELTHNGYVVDPENGFANNENIPYDLVFVYDEDIVTPIDAKTYTLKVRDDDDYLNSDGRGNYELIFEKKDVTIYPMNVHVGLVDTFQNTKVFDNKVYVFDTDDLFMTYNGSLTDLYDVYEIDVDYYKLVNDNYSLVYNVKYVGDYRIKPTVNLVNSSKTNNYQFTYDDIYYSITEKDDNIKIHINYFSYRDEIIKSFDNNEIYLSDFDVEIALEDSIYDSDNYDYELAVEYDPTYLGFEYDGILNSGIYTITIKNLVDKENSLVFDTSDVSFTVTIDKIDLNIKLNTIYSKDYDGLAVNYNRAGGNFKKADNLTNLIYDSFKNLINLKVVFEDENNNISDSVSNVGQYKYYAILEDSDIENVVYNNFDINIIYSQNSYESFEIYKAYVKMSPYTFTTKYFDNKAYRSYEEEFKNNYLLISGQFYGNDRIIPSYTIYYSNGSIEREEIINPYRVGTYSIEMTYEPDLASGINLNNYDIEIENTEFEIQKVMTSINALSSYSSKSKTYDGNQLDEYQTGYGNYDWRQFMADYSSVSMFFEVSVLFKDSLGNILDGYPVNAGKYTCYIDEDNIKINPQYEDIIENFAITWNDTFVNIEISKKTITISPNNSLNYEKDYDGEKVEFDNNYVTITSGIVDKDIDSEIANFSFVYSIGTNNYQFMKNAGTYDVYISMESTNYRLGINIISQVFATYTINQRKVYVKPIDKDPVVYNGSTYTYANDEFDYLALSPLPSNYGDSDLKAIYSYYLVGSDTPTEMIDAGEYKVLITGFTNTNYVVGNPDTCYTIFNIFSVSYKLKVKPIDDITYGKKVSEIKLFHDSATNLNNELDVDDNFTFKYEFDNPDQYVHVGTYQAKLIVKVYYNDKPVQTTNVNNSSFEVEDLEFSILPKNLNLYSLNSTETFKNEEYTFNDVNYFGKGNGLEYNDYLIFDTDFYLDDIKVAAKYVNTYTTLINEESIKVYDSHSNEITTYNDYVFTIYEGEFKIKKLSVTLNIKDIYEDKAYDGNALDEYIEEYNNYSLDKEVDYDLTDYFIVSIEFSDENDNVLDGYPINAGHYSYYVKNYYVNPLVSELVENNIDVDINSIEYVVIISKAIITISPNNEKDYIKTYDGLEVVFDDDYVVIKNGIIDKDLNSNVISFEFSYSVNITEYESMKDANTYNVYIKAISDNYSINNIFESQKFTTYIINPREVYVRPIDKATVIYNGSSYNYLDDEFEYLEGSPLPSDYGDLELSAIFTYIDTTDNKEVSQMIDASEYKVTIDSMNNSNYIVGNLDSCYRIFKIYSIYYGLTVNPIGDITYGTDLSSIDFETDTVTNLIDESDPDNNYTFEYEIINPKLYVHVGTYTAKLQVIAYYKDEFVNTSNNRNALFEVNDIELKIVPKIIDLYSLDDVESFKNEEYTFNDMKYFGVDNGLENDDYLILDTDIYLNDEIAVAKYVNTYTTKINSDSIKVYNSLDDDITSYNDYVFNIIEGEFEIERLSVILNINKVYNNKTYDGIALDEYVEEYNNYSLGKSLDYDLTDYFIVSIGFMDYYGSIVSGYPINAGYYSYYVKEYTVNPIVSELVDNNFDIDINSIEYDVAISKKIVEISLNEEKELEKTYDGEKVEFDDSYVLIGDGILEEDKDSNDIEFEFTYRSGNSYYVSMKDALKYNVYIEMNSTNYNIYSSYSINRFALYTINKREVSIKPLDKESEVYNGSNHNYKNTEYEYLTDSAMASDYGDLDFTVTFNYYDSNDSKVTSMVDAGEYKVEINMIISPNYTLGNLDSCYTTFTILPANYTLTVTPISDVLYGDDLSKIKLTTEDIECGPSTLEIDKDYYSFTYSIKNPELYVHVGQYQAQLSVVVKYKGIVIDTTNENNAIFIVNDLDINIVPKTITIDSINKTVPFNGYAYTFDDVIINKDTELSYNDYLVVNHDFYQNDINVSALNAGEYVTRINSSSIKVYNSLNEETTNYGDYEFIINDGLLKITKIRINVTTTSFTYGDDILDLNTEYVFESSKNDTSLNTGNQFDYFNFKIDKDYPVFDDLTYTVTFSIENSIASTIYKAGNYKLTPTLIVDKTLASNFDFNEVIFTVNKYDVTVDYYDKTVTYDGHLYHLDLVNNPLVLPGDSFLVDPEEFGIENAGEYTKFKVSDYTSHYAIYNSNDENVIDSYNFICNFGTLVINKKKLTVVYTSKDIEFDNKSHMISRNYSDVIESIDGLIEGHQVRISGFVYSSDVLRYVGDEYVNKLAFMVIYNSVEKTNNYEFEPYITEGIHRIVPRHIDISFNQIKLEYSDKFDVSKYWTLSKSFVTEYISSVYINDELVENFMDYGFGTYDAKIKISFNDEKIANSYELNETEFDVQIEIVKKKITVTTEKAILIYNGNDQTYEHYTETLKDSRFTFVLTNWKVVNDIDYVGVKNTVTIAIYFGDLDVTDNFEITKVFGTILVYEFAPIFIDRSTYTGSLIEITKEMVHTTDDSYIVSNIAYTCDTSIINAGTYKIHFTRIDFVDALGNPVELKTEAVENNMLIDFTVSKREVTLVAKDIVIEETYHEGMTITIPSDNVKDSSGEFDVVSLGVTVSVPSVTINEYTKWVVFDKNITIIAPSAVRDNFVFIQGSNLIYVVILNNE